MISTLFETFNKNLSPSITNAATTKTKVKQDRPLSILVTVHVYSIDTVIIFIIQ